MMGADAIAAGPAGTAGPVGTGSSWRMPGEAEPHARTWMAFGAGEKIWGHKLLPEVRRNLDDLWMRDIGHTDFYARFARPGVVLAGYDPDPASWDHAVTRRHLGILRQASDARGKRLGEAASTARRSKSPMPEWRKDKVHPKIVNMGVNKAGFSPECFNF